LMAREARADVIDLPFKRWGGGRHEQSTSLHSRGAPRPPRRSAADASKGRQAL
jgi:hypothetical protein